MTDKKRKEFEDVFGRGCHIFERNETFEGEPVTYYLVGPASMARATAERLAGEWEYTEAFEDDCPLCRMLRREGGTVMLGEPWAWS